MAGVVRKSDSQGRHGEDEPPLRAELFGLVQMEEHGKILAGVHKLSVGKARDQLLARLAENEIVLSEACNLMTAALKEGLPIAPAAEWLLDNFYLIEEQIRTAKRHFPKGYSKELPRLMNGVSAAHPRVYDIALQTISHGDGRIDPEGLSRFVASYEQVTPLTLGELWAIPIMLRLALIENLRRVAARLVSSRINCNLADTWADQMAETVEKDPSSLILLVADMARSDPPMVGSFVAELARRLQGQGPALTLPLTWIAPRLAEIGLTVEQLIQMESQQQAGDQVSISNSIGSLRLLGKMDWREFVETLSVVERTLRRDPHDSYRLMDFATRDCYRHVIETVSRRSKSTEVEIAEVAIELAAQAAIVNGQNATSAHVGFFLIGDGLPQLEHAVARRISPLDSCQRTFKKSPLITYLGTILLFSLLLTVGILEKASADLAPDWEIVLLAVLSLIGASQLAIGMVNWLVTILVTPNQLPRLDFSKGIAPAYRTLVAIPTMLVSQEGIEHLCEALEVRFLANQDAQLRFCLLTDFLDGAAETTAGDAPLLLQARQAIERMNEKYKSADGDKFFLLHRARRWNAQEKIWMGQERKRGKLADLNGFLRQAAANPFSCVVGNTENLCNVKYVITLDTDTQLPRDSARQFVATIAHPLNRAQYNSVKQRVDAGYGILQPRVSASLPSSNASIYQRLCSGDAGIDPYTRAASDVYQDVFGEGSFIGKGIYEVDAFEQALALRMPENQILSHDLLEGCYARSGLLSDVHLIEEYPTRYSSDVQRRHRWIRGDWQLIAWLLPRVPAAKAGAVRQKNPLSALSRWKIFDNLRRSLVSSSLTLLLLYGWTLSSAPWFWSGVVLGILSIPSLCMAVLDLMRKSSEVLALQHLSATLRSAKQHLFQVALTLAFLPYDAFFSVDAISRALWRMLVSHRLMLEWAPSNQGAANSDTGLAASFRSMWVAPTLAVIVIAGLIAIHPMALLAATPFLLAWLTAPAIAWRIGAPQARAEAHLYDGQALFLHRLARKIWSYYETLVGPDDHWLPPDNIQEHPLAAVAHRTSPTNIGLALLANLSAYDFAYISVAQLLERTGNMLRSMAAMERYRGHFYNWYDTQSLKPLLPMYISTVDSGNLAGHLLTLRPGLAMLLDQPIVNPRMIGGIADTFAVFQDLAGTRPHMQLAHFQSLLDSARDTPIVTLSAWHACLQQLIVAADALAVGIDQPENIQLAWWSAALRRQCTAMRDELLFLAPWSSWLSSLADSTNLRRLDSIPTLRSLQAIEEHWLAENVAATPRADATQNPSEEMQGVGKMLALGSARAFARIREIESLALQAAHFAQMDCSFLYDKATHLMTIGYSVAEQRCDNSYYDLLASEVRLCTFVMIAQGQLPQESWFALGRQLTIAGGDPILLSWSGSMFEYLMPLLVMPTFDNTLLDQTYNSVVQRQIEYGAQRDVPWGISESGFNTFDASLNYQYRAFGVPGLGLKRGLGDDLVVAPYATMLALMIVPELACSNLQRLAAAGFEGQYGLYEAIDYTATRLPRGQTHAVIQSFMAHHQGMGLLSLAYYLLDRPMQRRFESDPLFQATMLLLQEKIPKASAFYSNTTELADMRTGIDEQEMPMRVINRADTRVPEVQLLSNGRYHLMVTNSGCNSSRWKDLAMTRWREDGTCDNWGSFCYVRDCAEGTFWSTTHQPTLVKPDSYEVIFSEGRAEFRRRDNDIEMHTEIVVSPEDDIEMRRTHITNRSRVHRTIEVTSYTEVVLAPAAADAAHPAFSNLFVQTEILAAQNAILCSRRPRSVEEKMPWMLNLMVAHGEKIGKISFETDRAKFLGRGNTPTEPQAMRACSELSGNHGSVLDPIAAIRFQIELAPEQTAVIDIVIGAAESRDEAMHLVAKYQDRYLADRVFELAWTHSQVVLRQLNATEADAQLYARLAGSVIYANEQLRAEASILLKNRRGQSGLWSYAISGDLPIVLLQIKNMENIELVRQIVQAHAYWRLKGLAVDLVIWNEDHAGYRQVLQEQILGLIASGIEAHAIDRPGGIFVRLADQMSSEDRILLQTVARVVLCDSRGTLAEQLNRRVPPEPRMPQLYPTRPRHDGMPTATTANPAGENNLQFFNGLGGFTPDGSEYVITTHAGNTTPAPWVNVIANPRFGTVISESGQAYTWGENAHEFRLTPWNNDSVSDTGGEAFYLRDEESGHFWSPTPLPRCGHGSYVSRHGHGYSVFEHTEDGVRSELLVYVAMDASIKYSVLKIRNDSFGARKLSATGYVEWVLGDQRAKSAMHIVTESDPVSGALFAHNAYNTEFADRITFFDVDAANRTFSGDRAEFLGRNGSLQNPAALSRSRLSGRVGAGLDPCAAIQVQFDLAPGQEREIVFMLGVAGRRSADVSSLIHLYRGVAPARKAREAVREYWQRTLGAIQVETPDPALNLLANGWLMVQTIACRLWARSGFYQSGGAFGFRDQLQDVMALIHTEPHLVRAHLLLCAAHQFVDGDVQHWWHPPSDRGVRTHCSDDYLWLPLATHRYIQATGDTGILNENVHFLEGRAVNADEDSYYDLPVRSAQTGSLYEHCRRAISKGLHFGAHGLPLIGSCDWNDGMDKVGAGGKGESVWLGFFLYQVLMRFAEVAKLHGDTEVAEHYLQQATQLQQKIEANGWDGNWYRRAYFDDGTPLGSIGNAECQIDSIAQSWSVLSGAGEAGRARTAMNEVSQRLVRRESKLVQLLDPPFDKSDLNPGYIKGYAPGVRENGGQYTHAAVWAAMAFAKLGDRERAWELMEMINPINHATTAREVDIYKVEPYVLAADVYAVSPHVGRGGWTWYTGSAGWMYRLIVESLLGLHLEANTLTVKPCIPAHWNSFKLTYRFRDTTYRIIVTQISDLAGTQSVTVDGAVQADGVIRLCDDGEEHVVGIRVERAK
ncbi:MAG: glucoamylase family protein [Burkholderiaceae bacterium]|nr:glucoamylase family protein [Burkholderiaceae bacterium]